MSKKYKFFMSVLLVGSCIVKKFLDLCLYQSVTSSDLLLAFWSYTFLDCLLLTMIPAILLLIAVFINNLKASRILAIIVTVLTPIVIIVNAIMYLALTVSNAGYNITYLFCLIPFVLSIKHISKCSKALKIKKVQKNRGAGQI